MTSSPDPGSVALGSRWHEQVPGAVPAGATVLTSEEVLLPPEPQNVRVARRWVGDRVPVWAQDRADEVVLMASELVTNVVVHARTELVLGLTTTDSALVIGVRDLDLGRREAPGPERHGGRGLALVRELAAELGQVRHAGGGKTYWFRVEA